MTKKLAFLLATGLITLPVSASTKITMSVNGNLTSEIEPQLIQNRVYLPLRDLSNSLNIEVNWDNNKKEAIIKSKDTQSIIRLNEKIAEVNGEPVEMDSVMAVVNGRTMLPIRAAGELLGLDIEWGNETKTVYVYSDLKDIGIVPITPTNEEVLLTKKFDNIYLFEGVENQKINVTTEGMLKIEVNVPNIKQNIVRDELISEAIPSLEVDVKDDKLIIQMNVAENYISYVKNLEGGIAVIVQEKPIYIPTEKSEQETNSKAPDNQKGTLKYEIKNNHPVISITKVKGYDSTKVSIQDNYLNHNIVIDLGKDYSGVFDKSYISATDLFLNNVGLSTSNGTTKIAISEKDIYGVKIQETADTIEFHILRPRQVYDKIVVLDIGHGGHDSGAVGNGIQEKYINFNQSMLVEKLLSQQGIKAYVTRNTDKYIMLRDRSTFSNGISPHLFISFHNNSASSSVAKGTEVLYNPNSSSSKKAAQLVLNGLINNTGMYNRGIKSRTDLSVLKYTEAPAILIEVGFISNASDAAKLKNSEFNEKVALGIVQGIKKYLE